MMPLQKARRIINILISSCKCSLEHSSLKSTSHIAIDEEYVEALQTLIDSTKKEKK